MVLFRLQRTVVAPADPCAHEAVVISVSAWIHCASSIPYNPYRAAVTLETLSVSLQNFALLQESKFDAKPTLAHLYSQNATSDLAFHSSVQTAIRRLNNPFVFYCKPTGYNALALLPVALASVQPGVFVLRPQVTDELDISGFLGYSDVMNLRVHSINDVPTSVFIGDWAQNNMFGGRGSAAKEALAVALVRCILRNKSCNLLIGNRTASLGGICWCLMHRQKIR